MEQIPNKRINRIDYIVSENPIGVAEILLVEGIEPAIEMESLIDQTKLWIQENGKDAIVKLLQVHPEKDAILTANAEIFDSFSGCGCKSSFDGSACGCKSSFDGSACGCKSSFDGAKNNPIQYSEERENIIAELERKDQAELELHYKQLKRLLKKFPDDEELRSEIELTWDYLNSTRVIPDSTTIIKKSQREQPKSNSNQKQNEGLFTVNSKDLAIGSFVFGIAIIVSQIR